MPSTQETDDREAFKNKCPKYTYKPPILPAADRIIAIGDLHGDLKLTHRCLELAGVVDDKKLNGDKLKWKQWINPKTGKPGTTVVVQVGDQIDRCRPTESKKCYMADATESDEDNDVTILRLMTELDEQASKVGDRLVSLIGNHELMNMQGDLRYVSHKGLTKNGKYSVEDGKSARKSEFAKEEGHYMACTRLPCVIVGDFIFVHGGIIKDFKDGMKIKTRDDMYRVNKIVREWVLSLIDQDYVKDIIMSAGSGMTQDDAVRSMFWDRTLGKITPKNSKDNRCTNNLDDPDSTFKVLNLKKMIIGHTPQFSENCSGINETCDERVWRVDHGGSEAFNVFQNKLDKVNKDHRRAQVLQFIKDGDKYKYEILVAVKPTG